MIDRPIPFALSQWGTATEVLYKCPTCGCDFRILGDRIKYCFSCGQHLDWSTSIKHVSEQTKVEYEDLVYKQHAYTRGDKPQDEELRKLLYRIYNNEVS